MKKKILVTLMAVSLCFALAACGNKAENENTAQDAAQNDSIEMIPEQAPEDVVQDDAVIDVEENSKQDIDPGFAVDPEPAADYKEFAEQVKTAVTSKNIEMLAGLCTYPVYVGSKDSESEGKVIETKDDFMMLGVDNVITPDMMTAIEAVDAETLTEAEAGYTMMNGETGPSITFKNIDGVFGIAGINYGVTQK